MRLSSITVFFPCYNDAGTIPTMLLRAVQTLPQLTDDYEVVVINDGSQDDSALVLDEMARLYPQHVRIIHRAQPSGYGGVLRGGFAAARKDWIFYTDGDAQYDPRELTALVDAVADGVDMVNGYKIKRHDPFHRVVIGLAYQYFVKLAFGLVIRDVDCDFRLMRRDLFGRFELRSSSGTICVEMIKKLQEARCRFAEVPVHHFHRSVGRSQYFRPKWLFKTFIDLLGLWRELMLARPNSAGSKAAAHPAAAGSPKRH